MIPRTWECSVLIQAAFTSYFLFKLATSQKAKNMSSFLVGKCCWHSGKTGLPCAWDSQNFSMVGTPGFLALNASSPHKSLWQSEMLLVVYGLPERAGLVYWKAREDRTQSPLSLFPLSLTSAFPPYPPCSFNTSLPFPFLLFICVSVRPSLCLSIHPSTHSPNHPPIHLLFLCFLFAFFHCSMRNDRNR